MKYFENYSNIFLVGIAGIGMSALARFFNRCGKRVAGYDRNAGVLTESLEHEGIQVIFEDGVADLPVPFTNPEETLVVYTPAISAVHPQLQFFTQNGFEVLKRSQVLGLITKDMDSICVAGTHGKTTISTLVAHLLHSSSLGTNAFLGGISKNYQTNFLPDEKSRKVVLEADEFDRSFLQLTPACAVITSMDADHLDIYGTHEEMVEGFDQFARRIKPSGFLLLKSGLQQPTGLAADVRILTYGMTSSADYYPVNLSLREGLYDFDLVTPQGILSGLKMGIPGLVNVENAVAAIVLALLNGVQKDEVLGALPLFKGIARRFDIHVNHSKLIYIDDYAHHPAEIRATLASIRALYPGKRITGIFQPHLYTRTRDFAGEFAESLSVLDELVLLPLYPAREQPIVGVDSQLIASLINATFVSVIEKEELLPYLKNHPPEVLVTMGAGDIDRLVLPIQKWGNDLANDL